MHPLQPTAVLRRLRPAVRHPAAQQQGIYTCSGCGCKGPCVLDPIAFIYARWAFKFLVSRSGRRHADRCPAAETIARCLARLLVRSMLSGELKRCVCSAQSILCLCAECRVLRETVAPLHGHQCRDIDRSKTGQMTCNTRLSNAWLICTTNPRLQLRTEYGRQRTQRGIMMLCQPKQTLTLIAASSRAVSHYWHTARLTQMLCLLLFVSQLSPCKPHCCCSARRKYCKVWDSPSSCQMLTQRSSCSMQTVTGL